MNVTFEQRANRLSEYYYSLEEQYYHFNEIFFVHHSQFMNIPIVLELVYERIDYPVLAENTIKSFKSRICWALDQIRNSNITQLLRLILEARRAASNLGNFYADPSPLSSNDTLELRKDVPNFKKYKESNHPYFSCEASCSQCSKTFTLNEYPTLHHFCPHVNSTEYCPENIVIDVRRIYVIWMLCETLQLKEFEIEDICGGNQTSSSILGRSVYLSCTESSCGPLSEEILLEDAVSEFTTCFLVLNRKLIPDFHLTTSCITLQFIIHLKSFQHLQFSEYHDIVIWMVLVLNIDNKLVL